MSSTIPAALHQGAAGPTAVKLDNKKEVWQKKGADNEKGIAEATKSMEVAVSDPATDPVSKLLLLPSNNLKFENQSIPNNTAENNDKDAVLAVKDSGAAVSLESKVSKPDEDPILSNRIVVKTSTQQQHANGTTQEIPSPLPDHSGTHDSPAVDGIMSTSQRKNPTNDDMRAADPAKRRRIMATTNALTEYEANLTSKDRHKEKEAVRSFLLKNIRSDWTWEWSQAEDVSQPQDGQMIIPDTPNKNVRTLPDDQWKEREEWYSDINGSEQESSVTSPAMGNPAEQVESPTNIGNPYRFENPDSVGQTIRTRVAERKLRQKKRTAEEMTWNDGLRCYTERQKAWTCARDTIKPSDPLLVLSSPSPMNEYTSTNDDPTETEEEILEPATEIPIAPPLLPPSNIMRAMIRPSTYDTIYDKVVTLQLRPACLINLSDMTRCIVQGWKRNGEWPPRDMTDMVKKKKSCKSSIASLFVQDSSKREDNHEGKEEEGENKQHMTEGKGKGIKKSLQRILGLGDGIGGHGHGGGGTNGGEIPTTQQKGKENEL